MTTTHGRSHAVRARLVARGEDDTTAYDDRSAPQPRLVTLLDGCVEGVQVGMQDGGVARHEHMFAQCDSEVQALRPVDGRPGRMAG